jgi:RimJ/RimL family protein N-acetyltransferase
VWFHVDPGNTRSQKALQKIGATLSHTAPIVINGEAQKEYVFFRIDAPPAQP